MQLTIVKPSRQGPSKSLGSFAFDKSTTVKQLKLQLQQQKHISIHRQGLKCQPTTAPPSDTGKPAAAIMMDDDRTLVSYGIQEGSEVIFKDFGPQIGYRTVFVIEYLGPLLIVLLYAMRPSFIYGSDAAAKTWDSTALLGVGCWTLHFLKREFETFFVHRFSHPTMPLTNLFKNSTYYWSFGLIIGYPLCHPLYQAPTCTSQIKFGLVVFAISELCNFCVHVQLRNLRPAEGSKERPIPKGVLFRFVSCPNYTFEVLGWLGFSLFTQIFFGYAFTLVGFLQMADWALKKHRNYLKSYGDSYKRLGRKAIVPFVL